MFYLIIYIGNKMLLYFFKLFNLTELIATRVEIHF